MNRSLRIIGMAVLITAIGGCIVIDNPFNGLPPGPWRGVLKIDYIPVTPNPRGEPLPEKLGLRFEEVSAGELPFNFEVVYHDKDRYHLVLTNGEERRRIDGVAMGWDRASAKDTVRISFGEDGSYLRAYFEENVLEGVWVPHGKEEAAIPFVAWHGRNHRFTTLRKPPVLQLSGAWALEMGVDTDSIQLGLIHFQQDGNRLLAQFDAGARRFQHLEGDAQADKIYLSYFDGENAVMIEGKIFDNGSLMGIFRSARAYQALWQAQPLDEKSAVSRPPKSQIE
jgi:hypothetical protein